MLFRNRNDTLSCWLRHVSAVLLIQLALKLVMLCTSGWCLQSNTLHSADHSLFCTCPPDLHLSLHHDVRLHLWITVWTHAVPGKQSDSDYCWDTDGAKCTDHQSKERPAEWKQLVMSSTCLLTGSLFTSLGTLWLLLSICWVVLFPFCASHFV